MDRRRLKWVMILILALLNSFLLSYLVWQRAEERLSRRRMEEALTALFAEDGVTLRPEAVSRQTPPSGLVLAWDRETEAEAAAFFLGGGAEYAEETGIRQYSVREAVIRFYGGGRFIASGLAIEDGAALCREFCRRWSFHPPEGFGTENETVAVSAEYGGVRVANGQALFSFEEGILREVSGVLLPAASSVQDTEPLSASGALAVFQARRRENRAVASVISELSLCYLLERGANGELFLDPAWRVATDTIDYYVNCITGEIAAE